MPRNQLTKEEIRAHVEILKAELDKENYTLDSKKLAHKYLDKVLYKIQEYYR